MVIFFTDQWMCLIKKKTCLYYLYIDMFFFNAKECIIVYIIIIIILIVLILSVKFRMYISDKMLLLLNKNYKVLLWFINNVPEDFVHIIAKQRAIRAFEISASVVPAYTHFLNKCKNHEFIKIDGINIPITDKNNYIKKYDIISRCVYGKLNTKTGITIDESSGSSGIPNNWIRSKDEKENSHIFIRNYTRYLFGDNNIITINAFSLGAWATGINMGNALEKITIVKNVGADALAVLRTLNFFKEKYKYIICGYPPFLKHLIDEATRTKFPLHKYHMMGIVGGEGMSETLRDFIAKYINPVFSGYGASDLEIGMAAETPLSIAIRRIAWKNKQVHKELFGTNNDKNESIDTRLPMLFQYNPMEHYATTNDKGELIFTITRSNLVSPRIMYNIHDKGGVIKFSDMIKKLKNLGYNLDNEISAKYNVKLPFIWVHGRIDYTISIMGANIYPEDIEDILYSDKSLAQKINSYYLSVRENKDGTINPIIVIELNKGILPENIPSNDILENIINTKMKKKNADFEQATKEYNDAIYIKVEIFEFGNGLFSMNDKRIKHIRII